VYDKRFKLSSGEELTLVQLIKIFIPFHGTEDATSGPYPKPYEGSCQMSEGLNETKTPTPLIRRLEEKCLTTTNQFRLSMR
jgi:hypothetical protein